LSMTEPRCSKIDKMAALLSIVLQCSVVKLQDRLDNAVDLSV